MAFGLNINDASIEGAERIIATGSTGTSSGSVYIPEFNSNLGTFYNVAQQAGSGNLGIPRLSWNNSTKILSWSTPSASVTQDGTVTTPSYTDSTYYCIHEAGGPMPSSGIGMILTDPSGDLVVDGVYSNQIISRSADADFRTTLFASDSLTRAAVDGSVDDEVHSFVGRIFVGVYLYFFIEETPTTLNSSRYEGDIVLWKPKGNTIICASNGSELAYFLSSANTAAVADFGAEKFYLTTRKELSNNDSGMVVNKNNGDIAYFSGDDSVKTVRVTTIANAQNLAIGSFIDLSHSSVDDPAYLVSSTFPGYLRYVNSGNDTLIYAFGVRRISNTLSRAGWYLLTEVRSNRSEARINNSSTGSFDVIVGVYDVSEADGQDVPPSPPQLTQNSYSFAALTGDFFSTTFTTIDPNSGDSYSLSGQLPPGLSFNASTRTISGTPTSETIRDVTITVANDAGSDSAVVSFEVADQIFIPQLTQNSYSLTATQNMPFSFTFNAVQTQAGDTYSLSGAIPAGLSFNPSTRTLSGTPTVSGNTSLTVTLTNSAGSDSATVSIAIGEDATTLSSITDQGGSYGNLNVTGDIVNTGNSDFTINVSGDAAIGDDVYTNNRGDITLNIEENLSVVDDIFTNNRGNITVDVGGNLTVDDVYSNNRGDVRIDVDGTYTGDNVYSNNRGDVDLDVAGNVSLTGDMYVNNRGHVIVQIGGNLTADDLYNNNRGNITVVVAGSITLADDMYVNNDGDATITANGDIYANYAFTSASSDSSAVLTITSTNGNIVLDGIQTNGDGTLIMSAPNGSIIVNGSNIGSSYSS